MTQRFHSIVLAASFALLAGSATAKDHAVSSQPEFDEALAFVRPGDAIVFRNGNWRGVKLNFGAQGEPKKPVTLRAETPGSVVFTGSSELIHCPSRRSGRFGSNDRKCSEFSFQNPAMGVGFLNTEN